MASCLFSMDVYPNGCYTFTHFGDLRGRRRVFVPNDSPPITALVGRGYGQAWAVPVAVVPVAARGPDSDPVVAFGFRI